MSFLEDARTGARVAIVAIAGGEVLRRRLFSLGFHIGDRLEVVSRGIFRGPVLVKNLNSGITVAVGRSVARKITVEADDE